MFIAQTGCGKTHPVLNLIEKEYKNILITSLSSTQRSEKIMKPIMPGSRSKMMIKFGL